MQEQQSLGRDALNTDQTYMHAGMDPRMPECRKERGGRAKRKRAGETQKGGKGCVCHGAPSESVQVNTEHFTLRKKKGLNT